MYEKIVKELMKLRKESSNVSDRSIKDLAKSLEVTIADDEALKKIDFGAILESIDGNIRHNTKLEVEKINKKEKEKEVLDANKLADNASKQLKDSDKESDVGEIVAAAVQTALAPLTKEISSLKTAKVADTRKEQLTTLLEKTPKYYQEPILASFENMSFDSDAKFDTYLEKVTTGKDSFLQEAKENGLPVSTPADNVEVPEDTGEDATLKDALELVEDSKEKEKKD